MKATYLRNYKKILEYYNKNRIDFNVTYGLLDSKEEGHVSNKSQTISHWGANYSNPFHSIFLYKVNYLSQLGVGKIFFCRDGLFSLLDFFQKFPKPQGVEATLMINYKYQAFIPVAWIKNIVFYEFGLHSALNFIPVEEKGSSLIVKGILLLGDGHEVRFQEEILSKFKKIDLKKYKKVKIFLWCRDNYFLNHEWAGDSDYSNKLNEFYPKLMNYVKDHNDLSFINFTETMSLKSYHHYKYIDLNEKDYYIGDDYVDFLLLSKGVVPEGKLEEKRCVDSSFITLSAYHGFRLLGSEELNSKSIGSEVPKLSLIMKKFENKPGCSLNVEIYRYIAFHYALGQDSGLKDFKLISSK